MANTKKPQKTKVKEKPKSKVSAPMYLSYEAAKIPVDIDAFSDVEQSNYWAVYWAGRENYLSALKKENSSLYAHELKSLIADRQNYHEDFLIPRMNEIAERIIHRG